MADVEPKKGGIRAMFGMRSNKEPGARKKLSKKGSASNPRIQRFDSAPNPERQVSCSFTNPSIELSIEESLLPTYEDAAALTPHGFRDYPYAAASPVTTSNHTYLQPVPQSAEYRRNSEGQQQYAAPLYNAQSSRSASLPQFQDVHMNGNAPPVPVARAPPAKLSKAHRAPSRTDDILDKDTGERKDLTEMMHAFTFNEELDMIDEKFDSTSLDYDPSKPDGTAVLGSASPEIWLRIADFLSPLDVANLSSTCRTVSTRLGRHPYRLLLDPINRYDRLNFLLAMDQKLPRHLLCFPCAQWHLRIQPGLETLKPHNVLNPLFECPNRTNIHLPPPRTRITDGRTLPFAFIQLVRRSWAFGPEFGIDHQSLARRWKDPYSDWTHESKYHVTNKGHVLMRVKSQHYVEGGMKDAAKRLLLFSRSDYTPYFSVCSHWKHGILTSIPKCALDHIPFSATSEHYAITQHRKKSTGLVSLCSQCRPMRRCPQCPTEYLFELKFLEDKNVRGHGPERFKQAMLVTRWSDLGPARSPADAEWSAIVGENEKYDSFAEIGRRAVSGVFESAFTDTVPGQRILSTNPMKVKADDIGGAWY
ncbi:uncharacterized protein K460DRAFT_365419 [Cucurbitaria berberidis CBS 394.84]|uniref:F-box domain-containing protein n=1 Tax=Cucurbitaria berberidis CBS 394.84 TaxID=1168544 RepID=A0A9P4LCM7_9PLEO|nr:uncharacterized protein K460DRAFT_365419 [Cucurbitaria berberidis CBS 394.84]KAF1849532.1 hypothetical protein K460DRAFT_365419 [Cucurbitaria berberidis CBS 394.84]